MTRAKKDQAKSIYIKASEEVSDTMTPLDPDVTEETSFNKYNSLIQSTNAYCCFRWLTVFKKRNPGFL
ncbi:hypothetical protein ECANGB1_1011 [Enterospora canceri]|uniref:Uncharacterized protein n=1 Tax=Enterospora canceri TaxID=1081671 RepID=A0A1Y1S453_9MICR|nr:hypothetical protein ECANGB1_1011 [Enterospora canceri]